MPTPHLCRHALQNCCRLQVWLDNPADYFAQLLEADVLVSSDALDTQLMPGDPGLELPHAAHTAMNIGTPSEFHCSYAACIFMHFLDLRRHWI